MSTPFPWESHDWKSWSNFIKAHSPVLSYHPDEEYEPYSVELYMSQTAIKNKKTGEEVANTVDSMQNKHLLSDPSQPKRDEDWFMNQQYKGEKTKSELQRGDFKQAKAYIHIKTGVSQSASVVSIQYWLFYGYNRRKDAVPVTHSDVGSHQADWEFVTTRIDTQTGRIDKIYGSQHSGGDWYRLDELDTFQQQPMLYVSLGGHANYGDTGSHFNPFPLTDALKKGGHKWELKSNFSIVGLDRDLVSGYNFDWVFFKGDWGDDGVSSPGVKEEWLSHGEE